MEYLNVEKLNSVFELSKEETEAENRYMNLNSKEIESYQEIIDNIFKVEKTKANCELDLRVNNLWKYGISGDYNIITVKVKDYNDIESLKNILKAYKYLKYKNIDIEVAILTNIDISGIIAELKLENFVNQRKGIFILNKIPVSDKKIILASSTVVIN